jgi:bacterioferritin-associated ferredoxin
MYVCNCNGVCEQEVDAAIAAGAKNPRAVLAHHGCEPCCGMCMPEIAASIIRNRDARQKEEAFLVAAE